MQDVQGSGAEAGEDGVGNVSGGAQQVKGVEDGEGMHLYKRETETGRELEKSKERGRGRNR